MGDPATDPAILAFYELGLEGDRLAAGGGKLELARTPEIILRYLPEPPGRVLDVGGGPGVYAVWLAALGYDVQLIDPVELHVSQARELAAAQRTSVGLHVGDARALVEADASADAVLLLGPLYHLPDAGERLRALQEAHRVLKPGGLLFAAVVSRFASLFAGIAEGIRDQMFYDMARADIAAGRHAPPPGNPWWTTAYFHRGSELNDEVSAAGFDQVRILGVEGSGCLIVEPEFSRRWADPIERELLLEAARLVEADPDVQAVSAHLIAVAQRPAD